MRSVLLLGLCLLLAGCEPPASKQADTLRVKRVWVDGVVTAKALESKEHLRVRRIILTDATGRGGFHIYLDEEGELVLWKVAPGEDPRRLRR